MSLNITSLMHPTMIAKIRQGLKYAALNQGHMMNGHGNRVYIANRKGHNIIRINWLGNGKFIAWGAESKDVTLLVKRALNRANFKPDNVGPRGMAGAKLVAAIGAAILLTGCQASGTVTAVTTLIGALFT